MSLLMQVVVLVLHNERGVVAHVPSPILVATASAIGLAVEWLLQPVADLNAADASRCAVSTRVFDLVALLSIIARIHCTIRSHTLLKHVILCVRSVV